MACVRACTTARAPDVVWAADVAVMLAEARASNARHAHSHTSGDACTHVFTSHGCITIVRCLAQHTYLLVCFKGGHERGCSVRCSDGRR
jgi:hypothetical protein